MIKEVLDFGAMESRFDERKRDDMIAMSERKWLEVFSSKNANECAMSEILSGCSD